MNSSAVPNFEKSCQMSDNYNGGTDMIQIVSMSLEDPAVRDENDEKCLPSAGEKIKSGLNAAPDLNLANTESIEIKPNRSPKEATISQKPGSYAAHGSEAKKQINFNKRPKAATTLAETGSNAAYVSEAKKLFNLNIRPQAATITQKPGSNAAEAPETTCLKAIKIYKNFANQDKVLINQKPGSYAAEVSENVCKKATKSTKQIVSPKAANLLCGTGSFAALKVSIKEKGKPLNKIGTKEAQITKKPLAEKNNTTSFCTEHSLTKIGSENIRQQTKVDTLSRNDFKARLSLRNQNISKSIGDDVPKVLTANVVFDRGKKAKLCR